MNEDDYPEVTCPQCRAEDDDLDGFGFIACGVCGYCTHPSRTDGVCGICGHQEGSSPAATCLGYPRCSGDVHAPICPVASTATEPQ